MKNIHGLLLLLSVFFISGRIAAAQDAAIPGYDPNAPVFVHAASASAGETAPTAVKLPPVAKPGEHPCILLTPSEITGLKNDLQNTPRGKEALSTLLGIADGAVASPLNFPDPKGPPGQLHDRHDAVAQAHSHLSNACGDCGLAYALTGDVKYAQRAADILNGYADRYAEYPVHRGANANDTGKVMAQRLSEAMWLIPLIEGYDYIHDSGVLTAQNKQDIETKLLKAAVVFIRNKPTDTEISQRDSQDPNWRTDEPPTRKGAANWLFFYNAATLMTGAATGDKNLVDLGAADIRFLIHNGIGSDGMWMEGAIGYQFFAMSALTLSLETAARQGIDLWSFDDDRAKKLFDSPLRFAYPDGTAPGIGDSGRVSYGGTDTMSYDYAWLRYGDPAYDNFINESPRHLMLSEGIYAPSRVYQTLPETKTISYGSTLFESLGYAILRDDKCYALDNYGPVGPVHSHCDKLNLTLWAVGDGGVGDEIGGQPRFYRYENPLHEEWSKPSISHNTVTMDQHSQALTQGRLLVFEATPSVKVMRAVCDTAYPGALLDRTTIVTPDSIIDLFQAGSSASHTWDCTYRYQGALNLLAATPNLPAPPVSVPHTGDDSKVAAAPATPPPPEAAASVPGTPLGTSDGYQHFNVISTLPADNQWAGLWKTSVGDFNVTLAGVPKQQVLAGVGPDLGQMVVARQVGNSAAFGATYQMAAWGNPVQSVAWLPTDDGVRACQITQKDGTKTLVVLGSGAAWQAGDWKSDARVFYLRQTGATTTAMICGGTSAQGPGGSIQLTSAGNALAQETGGSLAIVSQWSPTPAAPSSP
jgi:hypothetical protein